MLRRLSELPLSCMKLEAGICVVGGGIAGLLTAAEASQSGRRVIVLESGDRKPSGSLDALNEVEQEQANYQTAVSGRVRGLGGTSTAWGGRMIPLTSHDMGDRDYIGLSGWPFPKSELDRHLGEIEHLFGLDHSSYEGLSRRQGVPVADAHIATRWAKWPKFSRRNIAHVLRRTIHAAGNLDVLLDATVCDFDLNESAGCLQAVVAQSVTGSRVTVTADDFVIACGTLESTRLLLLLDAVSRNRAFAGCNVLGSHFHDHLAIEIGRLHVTDPRRVNRAFGYFVRGSTRRSLHLEVTPAAQRADCSASGFVTVRPEFRAQSLHGFVRNLGRAAQNGRWRHTLPSLDLLRDTGAVVRSAYWTIRHGQMYLGPDTNLFLDARIEQVPTAASRLSLSDRRDSFGMPFLRMNWQKSAADTHTFRSVLRRARHYWQAASLHEAVSIDWGLPAHEDRMFEQARDTRHPAGTARMGTDRRTSVVDPNLRCHAVPNLHVVSAAVFPSSGSANPTLTIMQLAVRTGAALRDRKVH